MLKLRILCVALYIMFSIEAVFGQVIKTPNADIEFIGLRKWTAQDLYANIVAANPGKPFHACATYLMDVLKVAEASVTIDISQRRPYIIVAVVEPQFASRIHYKTPPRDTQPPIGRWSALTEIYKLNPDEYMIALQLAGDRFGIPDYDISKRDLSLDDETVAIIKKVWQKLELIKAPEDKALALETIDNDANYLNRIVALSVLGNFLGQDSTWQKVMESFCDHDARVLNSATALLTGHAQVQKRAVDWSPTVATLRALLDGTNLFAFVPTVKILIATKVSSKLAASLLKGGGALLVDFLKANRQSEKDLAHSLLVQLAGQDLGDDSARWLAWLNSL